MSRKISLVLFVLLCSAVAVFAQESKNVTVKGFNSVVVSSGIDLYVTQGESEGLVIKSSASLLKDVEIIQDGANLTIKYKDNISWSRLFKNQTIKAYLSYKTLSSLTASGGSDVYTQNTIKATNLTLKASGGSDLKASVNCTSLSLQVSGGSDADLSGSAENLDARASGGSDINAFELKVVNAKVSASGGSDAEVNVSKALDANASGGSDINYKGSPAVKKNSSVSGDVHRVN